VRLDIIFVALLAALVAAGCQSDDAGDSRLKVVATTTQIGAIVREVGGERVDLDVLLEAGADAHDFELSPRDMARINEADVVLRHGLGLDTWLDKAIGSAGGDAAVVQVTEGIPVRRDASGAVDPHVWHNPQYAATMVDNIARALAEARPADGAAFEQAAGRYRATLAQAEAEVRDILAVIPPANRKVVTNHDALGYFLEYYGLEFVAAVIPSANKDAQVSAAELAALQDLIEREGVKAIFAEAEVDPAVARQLARDSGIAVVEGLYADSLGEPGSGADTIHGMWLFNARKIAEALK